jgi:membrane dipeptidase
MRAAICLLTACAWVACGPSGPSPEEARRLHERAIVVDAHADTTPWFEDPDWRFEERHAVGHVDLPRLREGGLDVEFWSIYMGKREGDGRAIREAIERIDAVWELARRHPDATEVALDVDDVERIVASGRIASLMGLEGGHIIEDRLAALRTFWRLGVRYMTLTHSFHTGWADSSGTTSVPEPVHGGLAPFGEEVVREMNRLGMMVDISHVSDETFADALRVSRAPVVATHSSCRAVFDHPRNMSDDMLRALAANGGVVMINFYPGYIDAEANRLGREHAERMKPELAELSKRLAGNLLGMMRARRALFAERPWPSASMERVLDHYDHAIAVAGPDHVGIGADFDGVPSMPEGLEDASELPALTEGLLRRGHSEETVRKVLGTNLLRAMREAERVAAEIRDGAAATAPTAEEGSP